MNRFNVRRANVDLFFVTVRTESGVAVRLESVGTGPNRAVPSVDVSGTYANERKARRAAESAVRSAFVSA